jgi:ketosteroid isomerase-like protein
MFLVGRSWHYAWRQWASGNAAKWAVGFDADFEGEFFSGLGSYKGRAGILDAWEEWNEAFPNNVFEVEEVVDAGDDRILLLFHLSGKGGISGAQIQQRAGGLYSFKSGMITRARAFSTKSEALEAAGLREQPPN